MDNPSDILDRLSMAKLNNEVIWGREGRGEPDPRTYDERLNEARQRAEEGITSAAERPGDDTRESALEGIRALLDTAKDVYTTIGIKVGAELAEQKLRHERRREGRKTPETQAEDAAPAPRLSRREEFCITHSSDMFARMGARVNLQALGDYIRDGGSRTRILEQPFEERMSAANMELEKQVAKLTKDKETAEKMHDVIGDYEDTLIDIYFSLGAKVGARLHSLLLGGFDKDY